MKIVIHRVLQIGATFIENSPENRDFRGDLPERKIFKFLISPFGITPV